MTSELDKDLTDMLERSELPGWGESKMLLLERALEDLKDATVVLAKSVGQHGRDADRLQGIAQRFVKRAIERIDICHNDLDVEREMAEAAA